jgi:hypothetical protein
MASFNISNYNVIQYPSANPDDLLGFNVGMWKCLVILAGLAIALRILSVIFLRLLVSKF